MSSWSTIGGSGGVGTAGNETSLDRSLEPGG
jgi:hypothetical protein